MQDDGCKHCRLNKKNLFEEKKWKNIWAGIDFMSQGSHEWSFPKQKWHIESMNYEWILIADESIVTYVPCH